MCKINKDVNMTKNDKVYRKSGNKYVEIGHGWTGFPADGVWLVSGKTNNKTCIMQMKDLADVHLPSYAKLMLERDNALQRVQERIKAQDGWISHAEIYEEFAKALATGHEPFNKEKDEQAIIDNL